MIGLLHRTSDARGGGAMVPALLALAVLAAAGCGGGAPAGEALSCIYAPRPTAEHPDPGIATFEGCAVREGEEVRIAREHLEALDFGDRGLGAMLVAGQWYYLRPDGAKAPVVTWDNGPDDFSEGLARTLVDGKIAYLDERLEVVVGPRYDWGWPFADGLALVCRECRREKRPGEEHTEVVGGSWGYIDREGNEVVPLAGSRDQAREALERLSAADP